MGDRLLTGKLSIGMESTNFPLYTRVYTVIYIYLCVADWCHSGTYSPGAESGLSARGNSDRPCTTMASVLLPRSEHNRHTHTQTVDINAFCWLLSSRSAANLNRLSSQGSAAT